MVERITVTTSAGIVGGLLTGQWIVSYHLARARVGWYPYLYILVGGATMGGIAGMLVDDLI